MPQSTLPEDVKVFLSTNDIAFPRVNEDALRAAVELFRRFRKHAKTDHDQALAAIKDVLAGYCGAWREQLHNHLAHLKDGYVVLIASSYDIDLEGAVEKLAPLLAGLRDDVIEFVAHYREIVDMRGLAVGGHSQSRDIAQEIINTVRFRCDTANVAVADALAVVMKALEAKTDEIQNMIASVDDVGRSVGPVHEMRIDVTIAAKLADSLAQYADVLENHGRTLTDGLASLNFILDS